MFPFKKPLKKSNPLNKARNNLFPFVVVDPAGICRNIQR